MSTEILSLTQWPAFIFGLIGSLLVASHLPERRLIGFVLFFVSNIFWLIWGLHAEAKALILMQLFFLITSYRGCVLSKKSRKKEHLPRIGAIPIEN